MFNLNVSLLKKRKTLYVSVEQFEVLSENVVFFPPLIRFINLLVTVNNNGTCVF